MHAMGKEEEDNGQDELYEQPNKFNEEDEKLLL